MHWPRGAGKIAVAVVAVLAVAISGWRSRWTPEDGTDHAAAAPLATGERRAEAVVLVNSTSDGFADFTHLIGPSLEHFGVPTTIVDLAGTPLPGNLGAYSVIVIGHRGLDAHDAGLDAGEQTAVATAIQHGTGLVNFDNNLWERGAPRYGFMQQALGLAPVSLAPSRDVSFAPPDAVTTIDLSQDGHQQPVLTTTSDPAALDGTDGAWSEFLSPVRGVASVMAGPDEFERHALPPMHFSATGLRPGKYDVLGTVFTGAQGWDARYYFGFSGEAPRARHIDAVGGSGGPREHTEYILGRLSIDRTFELVVQDADLLRGTSPVFGWARVRLVRVASPATPRHFITARHAMTDLVPTASMTMAGMRVADGAALAFSDDQPLLAVGALGAGRVAQWGSYDWMRADVRGPLGGLDDLVWRSLVWTARRPFALQLLPPILTMRVDDESGPLEWLRTAIDAGFKPWVGVFLSHIDDLEARELSMLARAGSATVSVHSFDDTTFFYFDHVGRREWPAATMAANVRRASEWHRNYDIPMSTHVVPHFYEIGANALPGLAALGVESMAVHMAPGNPYGVPWLRQGPYRREARGSSATTMSVYYADELETPGQPELRGRLFNCVTEIRDDAGYEWYPTAEVGVTVGRGIRQVRRALDSRAIATLFTHGYFIPSIPAADWRTILEAVVADAADYAPVQMTLDAACALARGQHTSAISAARYGPHAAQLRVTLTGHAEVATSFGLFHDDAGRIVETTVWVPPFTASVEILAGNEVASFAAMSPVEPATGPPEP